MADRLIIIGITLPGAATDDEAGRITALLDSGAVDRIHIRKDDSADTMALLDMIPTRLHNRLSIHRITTPDHCDAKAHGQGCSSCSCHSIDEARRCDGYDYVFLSPVFDSISKPGYRAVKFDPAQVKALEVTTIALGGVTPERFDAVSANGFDGAAMLGYLWQENDVQTIIDNIRCYNS